MPNPDPPPPKSTATQLPTELSRLFERTLASHDAAGTLLRPAEQVDLHDQVSKVKSDGLRAVGASADELDQRSAMSPGDVDVASNLCAEDSKTEPLVQDLVDKIRGEILEAAIGLGFLLVGIAVFVALAVLPHKPGMWIFMFGAGVLMVAGGRRIDAATRAHRRAKHNKSRRAP